VGWRVLKMTEQLRKDRLWIAAVGVPLALYAMLGTLFVVWAAGGR